MIRSPATLTWAVTAALVSVAAANDPASAPVPDPAAASSQTQAPSPAPAADPAPVQVTPENWDAQRATWTARLRAAVDAVARAEARHTKAIDAYSHMRARRRDRGSEKQAILDELAASDEALDRARVELRELRASARRAGVPPGWLRDAGAGTAPPARPADDAQRR
jgi:hypothetical protein